MTTTPSISDIQLDMEYKGAVRFPAWVGLAVCSAICMAAFCSETPSDERKSDQRWALAVYSISMCVSVIATLAYLFVRGIFAGQIFETGMVTLLLVFWGIGLPVIMKPDNSIAVANDIVINANLYFFSWGCFAMCIFLTLSLFQENMGVNVRQLVAEKQKQMSWFYLAASSLVVMGSAVRIYRSDAVECGNEDGGELYGTDFCKRTTYALSLGTITFVAAIAIMLALMKHLLAAMMELGATVILLILWIFGVGFITFGGSKAPGANIGNLYFSTWISFILIVQLFAKSLQGFLSGGAAAEAHNTQQDQQQQEEGMEDVNAIVPPHEDDF
eukprot:CAMPEP_0198141170 /NCGR_PEP_ID=MMETSP1443-20131203/4214_1 /TAXON_ID=186043 /ORGANISM="Entomoneis sp., Strain CCMP2396" /LENGTH=328 /DNA_ID=CAMNT_0043803821 /DNA_START=167 /DNA_END=1153 /DNA_ORIENTATION=-